MKHEIAYPGVSEAEVQAELWALLKMRGFDARLDVPAPNGKVIRARGGDQRPIRRGSNRLDIVVFHRCIAAVIVEVKRSKSAAAGESQRVRYGDLYRPKVLVCKGDPAAAVAEVEREMAQFYAWYAGLGDFSDDPAPRWPHGIDRAAFVAHGALPQGGTS